MRFLAIFILLLCSSLTSAQVFLVQSESDSLGKISTGVSSAFLVHDKIVCLTRHSVLELNQEITLANHFRARVIYIAEDLDLAFAEIIDAEMPPLTPMQLLDVTPDFGVGTINPAFPRGQMKVSHGAIYRDIRSAEGRTIEVRQPCFGGQSGSPVMTRHGKCIGMVIEHNDEHMTAVLIPADVIKGRLKQFLDEHPRYAEAPITIELEKKTPSMPRMSDPVLQAIQDAIRRGE